MSVESLKTTPFRAGGLERERIGEPVCVIHQLITNREIFEKAARGIAHAY
jgi:hypothetical protein